ncbi:MAG: hypothetical protein ACTXOO_01850 [Sodalis sp. (in: enterobacteria)]
MLLNVRLRRFIHSNYHIDHPPNIKIQFLPKQDASDLDTHYFRELHVGTVTNGPKAK